ncbi:DNA polymerase III subunit beta [Photobacterium leiognathi]|uniref:DNA polymerase III subunit beta n=1 Tax=Photobacterium leiognathi TaxID=553611 RepID=UPI002981F0BB|nr:DNA polymerase III subunit beta [Photobacterium leiognathi]
MKFNVNASEFKAVIAKLVSIVPRRGALPILSNFYLSADVDSQTLHLVGTDLEVEKKVKLAAEVIEGGQITIPANKINDILGKFSGEEQVKCSQESAEKFIVRVGRSRYQLATLPATEYPTTQDFTPDSFISISAVKMKTMLDSVSSAMANQDVRYYLNGVFMSLSGQGVTTVATDGHRMAIAEYHCDLDASENSIILPKKCVLELAKLLNTDSACSISFNQNSIKVEVDSVVFVSKLIDGKYPDVKRLIQSTDNYLTMNTADFNSALSRTKIVADEKFPAAAISFEDGEVRLVSASVGRELAEMDESGVEFLEADFNITDFAIKFNIPYMLDVLSSWVAFGLGDKFTIKPPAKESPMTMSSIADSVTHTFVIMPVR